MTASSVEDKGKEEAGEEAIATSSSSIQRGARRHTKQTETFSFSESRPYIVVRTSSSSSPSSSSNPTTST